MTCRDGVRIGGSFRIIERIILVAMKAPASPPKAGSAQSDAATRAEWSKVQ